MNSIVYTGNASSSTLNNIFSRFDNTSVANQPAGGGSIATNCNTSGMFTNPLFVGNTTNMTVPSVGLYQFKCDISLTWSGSGTFASSDFIWMQVINTSTNVKYAIWQCNLAGISANGAIMYNTLFGMIPFTSTNMPIAIQVYHNTGATPTVSLKAGSMLKINNNIA